MREFIDAIIPLCEGACQLEESVDFADLHYGFWLTDKLEILPVTWITPNGERQYRGHESVARDHYDSYMTAFEHGWCRVSCQGTTEGIAIQFYKADAKILKRLVSIVNKMIEFIKYEFDGPGHNDYHIFYRKSEALNYLNRVADEAKMMTETFNLNEDLQLAEIYVTLTEEELHAEWIDEDKLALQRLYEFVEQADEREAYYLNSMLFLSKQQALVSLNSLLRD